MRKKKKRRGRHLDIKQIDFKGEGLEEAKTVYQQKHFNAAEFYKNYKHSCI